MPDSESTQHSSNSGKSSSSKRQTFFRRLSSTLCLWGVVGAAFYCNNSWLWFVSLLILSLGGLREYFQLFPPGNDRRYRWHSYLAAAIYLAGLFSGGLGFALTANLPALEGSVIALLMISIVLSRLRTPLDGIRTLHEIMVGVFGFVYIILLIGFVGRILLLPLGENQGQVEFYLLYLLAVTKFTDTGAYAIGSLIGRDKMVPNISPGKTWQGFGGAIFAAFVASFGCLWLLGDKIPLISAGHAAILAILLALIAVLGDLAESILKRSLGAKDSGHLFPGIGGILDLIDSLLFTAPVFYFYLVILSR